MAQTLPAPSAESISMRPSDAFFWLAEAAAPEIRPLVAGLFLLDRRPDRVRLRAAVERLTVRMPRLRQHVLTPAFGLGMPVWKADAGFDLDYHLRDIVLPGAATWRQLLHFSGELFSTPLDHLRPLWEAHLIRRARRRARRVVPQAAPRRDGRGRLDRVVRRAHRCPSRRCRPRPPPDADAPRRVPLPGRPRCTGAVICSNVPGPPLRRFLAGARIEAVYPFAPVMRGTPLTIALLSYGDSVGIGIDTDPAVIPDPERIGRQLERAVDEFQNAARQGGGARKAEGLRTGAGGAGKRRAATGR